MNGLTRDALAAAARREEFTVGSLCSGYGGLDLAVSAVLDTRPLWVADNDPGACHVLAHRFPGVPNLGDLTDLDWDQVPRVDVLTAGFPCQDLSYAGRGAGITEGTRSGLWLTIAHAVRTLRPKLVVLENVRAIVARRPGLDAVLSSLADLGFDADWTCVRASDVGAPHIRERWFCLAWPADPGSSRLEGNRLRRATPERGGAPSDAHDVGRNRSRARRPRWDEPAAYDLAAADAHGDSSGDNRELSSRRHAVQRRLRNDAAGCGPTATDPDQRRQRPHKPHLPARQPNVDWGDYGPAVHRWEAITGRPAPRPTDDRRRLAPCFVEWLMGLPPGWVTDVPGLTRNQQLTALGNGVVPAQAIAALHTLLPAYEHATAPTLEATP